MENEITITQIARGGYSFTLPVAPCKPALAKLKQLCPGYQHGSGSRWIPEAKLDELVGTLDYWFGDAFGDGWSRNGSKCLTVRVVELADEPENIWELMRVEVTA